MSAARIPTLGLAVIGLLSWACTEVPTEVPVEAVDATAEAKGGVPGPPGGGGDGGGDSGVTSLIATFGAGSLVDDGAGPYVDQECGVEVSWDNETSFFDFRPLVWLNKKQERDIRNDPACSDIFPRSAAVDLANAVVRSYCVAPASFNECTASEEIVPPAGTTLDQLAGSGVVDHPNPDGDPFSSFGVRVFDANRDGNPSTAPGGLNTEYCLDDGTGRPLRFDSERSPGSNELLYTTTADGIPTRFETQAAPNNVGSCAHTRSDGTLVVLSLELDVAIDLTEKGS